MSKSCDPKMHYPTVSALSTSSTKDPSRPKRLPWTNRKPQNSSLLRETTAFTSTGLLLVYQVCSYLPRHLSKLSFYFFLILLFASPDGTIYKLTALGISCVGLVLLLVIGRIGESKSGC